ncbi:hypothetical protein AA313_de0205018 [Arthrobotrys entomopaga]|nr:hypothetical protein AA313_de0205018 [Arthrobotrys entomopaga]
MGLTLDPCAIFPSPIRAEREDILYIPLLLLLLLLLLYGSDGLRLDPPTRVPQTNPTPTLRMGGTKLEIALGGVFLSRVVEVTTTAVIVRVSTMAFCESFTGLARNRLCFSLGVGFT